MFTREEFENLINNSPLFDVDKESCPELYKTEKFALFTLLADYYQTYIFPYKPLENYSYTLIETATECLKYYDKAKGEFLHLFNKAMKRDLRIAKAKEIIETHRQGIQLSTYEERMIRKIVSLAKSKNLDIYDSDVQAKIGLILGICAGEVAEFIRINDNAVAIASAVKNDDGDEIELFDLVADGNASAENAVVAEDSFKRLIVKIDCVFKTVQVRQKKLLSLLLTAEILKALEYDVKEAVKLLGECNFFNREIIGFYEKLGHIPTAKQIGEECGASEQSVSRTYKNFKEKLQKNC